HRVDLARHDAVAWLHLRQVQLADARARTASHQPDVGGDLPEADGDGLERAVGGNQCVERGLGMEVVARLLYVQTRPGGELPADRAREVRMRVDACADGRTAQRDDLQLDDRLAGPPGRLLRLAGVAPKLLAQPDRGGVLEVGATGLDLVLVVASLSFYIFAQLLQRRQQLLLERQRAGDVDRRRDHGVRGLALVCV